ncbi:FUSC family protein [Mucilaginibacter auburnensis]|uniref:Putative membrane protein (TIGR01666 family) n=1 Tax=Mucilaginibacter auburnensis TaxID=1457233 RepID=A0A2H9VUA5_9SPHI|nr:FUSC family membrane protein [Mucilaginibacter auburnensis]PJJ84413.1 putative membrane protein (TIGR01666 family) [Mucilaginibacter auburnensis]
MLSTEKEVKSFFFSQYFSDGLRMSLGILIPALTLLQFDRFDQGIALSLGAVCLCVVDNPGPVLHKRNAMLIGNACMFVVAMITGFARFNVFALGLEVTLFTFLFSMFTVYGNRAASVGTAALLIMIFMIDRDVEPDEVLKYSGNILAGGIWYMVFSLVFFGVRPYRAAQQALGENIDDIVKFLRLKADFYLHETDIEENYRKVIAQQIKVSEHQDLVRELLFKSRVMVRESTNASRILVLTFVDLVDMFDHIMATHYDYQSIREKFQHTGVLPDISDLIQQMANELEQVGYMVLSNNRYKNLRNFMPELEQLKQKIDTIGNEKDTSTLVLKKILINLRDLNKEIENIWTYYHASASKVLIERQSRPDPEYSKFVSHQDYDWHIFFDNFNLQSGAFKHALRVSLVCLVGFTAAKLLPLGHHSYWILLTIIVILKPGFSLSKQRNYQRLFGTIAGGIIGILILMYIPNSNVQFALMVVLMIGTYSFIRLYYVVSVICMTPYVLILFKFLGVGGFNILEERILDTAIGSGIAIIASYLIFPTWEFQQIRKTLAEAVIANTRYLVKATESLSGNPAPLTEYKLARKDVYIKSANLSAAFQRMTSEPKSKQRNIRDVHKFVVLNHILSSYIATVAAEVGIKPDYRARPEAMKSIRKSLALLNEAIKKLGGEKVEFYEDKTTLLLEDKPGNVSDALLKEQVEFINKISVDITKVTEAVVK